jgi:crotonobetainyl-CoA:carnitine CoA-transferase CaiB-like acyl-CoA transferase
VTTREVSDRHGGVITIPAPPWHFSGHEGTLMPQLPARQGEDNDDILKQLGYTTDQIQALITTAALIEPARDLIVETDS